MLTLIAIPNTAENYTSAIQPLNNPHSLLLHPYQISPTSRHAASWFTPCTSPMSNECIQDHRAASHVMSLMHLTSGGLPTTAQTFPKLSFSFPMTLHVDSPLWWFALNPPIPLSWSLAQHSFLENHVISSPKNFRSSYDVSLFFSLALLCTSLGFFSFYIFSLLFFLIWPMAPAGFSWGPWRSVHAHWWHRRVA